MPVMMSAPLERAASTDPPHKRWTREECAVLESAGLLELERYELVEGELIQKLPKSLPYMQAIMALREWFIPLFGITSVVPGPSIDVAPEDNPRSEPEPDVVVLAQSLLRLTSLPCPKDIRMLVEVSVTSLGFDLTTKAALYARAAIADYWVLDVAGRRMIIHCDPAEGRYRSIVAYSEDEFVAPLAAPDSPMRVGDLL
jgi:Uma2 family endonuclease